MTLRMMVDRDSLTLDRISPLFVGGRVWLQAGNTTFPLSVRSLPGP
ncbi:hypothetical protein [Pseudofrankia inefficax]|uniref:Uncharacterized protein n=1 Tax=Pseudofrankia inefficax (strain DSM 45817 / CECT 9037 / DDB 130130 / EuI1c) TaxID=298654 RepID=E3J688_PSEI1|nr:hypothetical protein [Pseudofrankia inefficax]ADP79515.1 hypothetical protein FraEuI1c_1451 [Pseudofrankia inefficax]